MEYDGSNAEIVVQEGETQCKMEGCVKAVSSRHNLYCSNKAISRSSPVGDQMK